jgi:hypothetical protein
MNFSTSGRKANWEKRKRQANGTDRDMVASFDSVRGVFDDLWSGLTVDQQTSALAESAVLAADAAAELETMRGDWHRESDAACTCSACVCETTIEATSTGIDVRSFVRKMDERDQLKFIGLGSKGRDLTETETAVVARLAPNLTETQRSYVAERVPWLSLPTLHRE